MPPVFERIPVPKIRAVYFSVPPTTAFPYRSLRSRAMFDIFSKPNSIDTLEIPGITGKLGLAACPGVRQSQAKNDRETRRRAKQDLRAITRWGADGVVTLMEDDELERLGLYDLPDMIESQGLWWKYLPIEDMYLPDDRFESRWEVEGDSLRNALQEGQNIIIHCYAGLGRTGMIAARLMVELGMSPRRAIYSVRHANSCRIQTRDQFYFVKSVGEHIATNNPTEAS